MARDEEKVAGNSSYDAASLGLFHSLRRNISVNRGEFPGISPVGDESVASPDRILQTATRLFSERGFGETSVAAIAAAADVNKALIYYYFEDKQGLYKDIIDSALADLLKIWNRDEVKNGAPPERLAAYLRTAANLMKKNSAIAPLIFSEIIQTGEMQDYIVDNFFLPNALNLVLLINEGAEQGYFKELESPMPIIPAIMGGLFVISRVKDIGLLDGLPVFDNGADYFDSYIDYVLKGLSVNNGRWTDEH
ncbi:MAG: TetR/AcrR family transcriptional regulator [bacterium]|nr:TetR/AcrR family transcriptional regulator [bacterium]